MSRQQQDTTGALNGWHCPECGWVTMAIHTHHGVTPMFLACRGIDGCPGLAVSLMYPWERAATYNRDRADASISPQIAVQVQWEWYQPGGEELAALNREARQHVQDGGLLLRPITDLGRRLLERRTRP